MVPLKSPLYALLILFVSCAAACGQTTYCEDQDPFPGFGDAFWKTNGLAVTFFLLDGNNKFQQFLTKGVIAKPIAGINHDVDRKGVGHSHWHFRDDYLAAYNLFNTDFTPQANAYWDVVFQAGIKGDSQRFESATTQRNCFTYYAGPIDRH